jgi:hypothetical protein
VLVEFFDVGQAEEVCCGRSLEVIAELSPRHTEGVAIPLPRGVGGEHNDISENGGADDRHRGCAGVEDQGSSRRGLDRAAANLDRLGSTEDGLGESRAKREQQC